MLLYDEIFYSIQGESTDAGRPCVFVRLYGCNVRCTYCDQPQVYDKRHKISVGSVIKRIRKVGNGCRYVCITGGEPLLQDEVYPLIYELISLEYDVSIETNGCVPIDNDPYNRKFKYVMDVKCPSSGVSHKNILDNLMNLKYRDEVKFVVKNREDYEYAKHIIHNYPTQATILFSPMFKNGKPVIGSDLIEWIKKDRINARLQVQMHKVLNVK